MCNYSNVLRKSLVQFTGMVATICMFGIGLREASAQIVDQANREFEQGAYAKALDHYKQQMDMSNQDLPYLHYRIGECYLLMNRPEEAVGWFDSAKGMGYSQPSLLYALGETNLLLGKYNKALEYFTAYSKQQIDDQRTADKIASCHLGMENKVVDNTVSIVPLASLNTAGSEYGISYNPNKQLIFSSTGSKTNLSRRNTSARTGLGYSKLYLSERDENGSFKSGTEIDNFSSEKVNRGVVSFDPVSNNYYCTTCIEGEKDCYISILKIKGKRFRELGKLEIGGVNRDIGHPFIADNGQTLYFTSTMAGGYGGDDIWYSKRMEDGKWGKPVNAGPRVNTAGNEVFPYVHQQLLIFSSDGHEGYGGLDLFASKIGNEGFSVSMNLGLPFNSEKDDFNLIVNDDERGGLMVSNRNNETYSDNIYQFTGRLCTSSIEGGVFDRETKQAVKHAMVTLIDGAGKVQAKIPVDSMAHYHAQLHNTTRLVVIAKAEGYDSSRIQLEPLPCFTLICMKNGFNTDIYLDKVQKAQKEQNYIIRSIYYEFDMARITNLASEELDRIAALMQKYPQINIKISSYTDNRGSIEYNQRLSEERSESAAVYLIKKGISSNRIEKAAYGEMMQVVEDANSEDEQQLSRRTSFHLTSASPLTQLHLQELTPEKLLLQKSPNEISELSGWWIQVASVRHSELHQLVDLEKELGVSLQAIRFDDEWMHLCVGPFETQKAAQDAEAGLKNKGVETSMKYIAGDEK